MKNVYGYIYMSAFQETGFSEKGAKVEATKAGSDRVGYRSPIHNMFISTSVKCLGKWSPVNNAKLNTQI